MSAFFDVGSGFASTATLDGEAVQVILDEASIDVLNGVITANPSVLVSAEQAAEAEAGQTLVIGAQTYTVRAVMSDGPDAALKRLDLVRA
jgi:hypothetical protein